jgi:hypothetical protein
MGYYSDNSSDYEGDGTLLLTLRQLIAGEGGNANHEAIFTYLMGFTFGPNYRDRRAGQMFLLVASPLMRVVGAWDCYEWEKEYGMKMGLDITPTPPLVVVSMLSAIDNAKLSPYMLLVLSRGLQAEDYIHLNLDVLKKTPLWLAYQQVVEDRSLAINYITRELGYSSYASVAIHNLIMEGLYVSL